MNDKKKPIDKERIRSRFPALATDEIFMDNAGGAQLPKTVIDRVREYMIKSYVQVGADYPAGRRATQTVADAHRTIETLMNADGVGHVALGPSTSVMCAALADCYARALDPQRNEIVVCEAGHEANIGPWTRLADRGYTIKTWRFDPDALESRRDELSRLLGKRTRILAAPHVSNLLGQVEDIKTLSDMAHEVGARIVVDGVAFSPHRAMDVAGWGVDWYVFSIYKIFGPHMAAMFGANEAFSELSGPNHFFIDRGDVPYKFELGGVLHEGCAGILGLVDYFKFLAGAGADELFDRSTVESAFAQMTAQELPLQKQLIEYLKSKRQVRLIGPAATGSERVPTISFVHASKSSKELALKANEQGIGIRYGHFYAYRLAQALGLNPDDGVVRASLLHYNTQAEVERLIDLLESVI